MVKRMMRKLLVGAALAGCLMSATMTAQAAAAKIWQPTKLKIYIEYADENGKNPYWFNNQNYKYTYNSKGQLTEINNQILGSGMNPVYTTLTYKKNKLQSGEEGMLLGKKKEAWTKYTFKTNKDGLITQYTEKSLTGFDQAKYTYTIKYAKGGQVLQCKYKGKVIESCKYDKKGRMTSYSSRSNNITYSKFDKNGNPRKIVRLDKDTKQKTTFTLTYTYDKKGRMKEVISNSKDGKKKAVYSGYKKVYSQPLYAITSIDWY